MSSTSLSLPCPVRLGIVREAGPRAELHRYTLERNLAKMDRLLRKGVDVDCVNDEGQSALFIACLLGLKGPAEVLLKHGANPNHRCFDQSTPVHAAVFSCSARLVSVLLDAGGDLRLHDKRGHTPQHWATSGGQPNAKKMLEFLQSCMVQMQSVVHRRLPGETPCSPSSSKMLLPPSPLKHLLRLGGCDVTLGKKSGGGSWSSVQCFGFGKVCTERRGRLLGLQACVPLVSDVELTHTQDEPPTTFTLADCTQMSNLSWRGCRVTVKDLVPLSGSCEDQSEYSYRDLLQREHEYCSRLLHPHLLQQLAVALGADLHTRLVFERVHIGPLHTIIHHKRESVPVLRGECVYGVLLQVCDALTYLHSRQLVMRSLSSHNVMMLTHTHAKLTGLGFISAEDGSVCVCGPPPALPPVLYNWAAPEVIAQQHCTHKADIYSVCCLLQEIYTDALPWGRVCVEEIFDQLERGCGLLPHPSLPRPFYDLIELGLQPHPINRTLTLEQLRYTLTSHVKDVSDASCSLSPGAKRRQDILSPRGEQGVMRGVRCSLDSQIQQELSDLDHMLRREEERGVEDRSREEEERRRSRQVEVERRRREEEEERRSREEERWRSREEERRKSREEERRRRERERSETQRRGSGVNVVSIRKVVGERDERADEEESDTMEGDSDTETEVESTTSVFTERWEESEREREKRLSYPLTLSLDDWRASLAPDTTSLDGESEAEAGLNKGAGLGGSGVCDVMSSIVLNQQVCRTLLHECERSLESAEQHTHTLSYTNTPSHTSSHTHTPLQGYDEVDCGGGGGVAVGGLDDDGGGVVVSGAVGPPSKYTPQVDRGVGGPWARSGPGSGRGSGVSGGPGGGIEEVGAITLGGAMWLGAFPSSSEESLTMNTATTHHTHTQTGEYESVKQSRTSSYRRSSGSSSVQSEDVPPLQSAAVSPPRPHWTNEVAELVSRMACGRLGSCAAPPISSESEDYEEMSGQRQPIRDQNGEYRPISNQREEYRPISSEDAAQIPATSRHSQQDLKLESIFKSFAGAETSEDEEVCVSSSRTFITPAQEASEGATPAATTRSSTEQHSSTQHHQPQQLSPDSTLLEDSDSDSEMHSMIEESSMYHTPGPGTEDPSTEEEDLDVTVEVCRPASLSMHSHTGECVSALHSAEEQEEECDQELQDVRCVSCNKQIDDPSLLRRLPDLSAGFAEISSISCSPAQQNIPLSRRPSYSTPRSPHRSVHQSCIPGAPTAVQALPSLQNLLDTHTPSHTPSQESASTSKATEESDEEEADSSAASQSGFLSVSSRQLRETGLAEEGRRGMSGGDVEAESDDQDEEDDRASASVCSGGGVCEAPRSFSPSSSEEEEQPSRTASLAAFEEEEERMLSQEREETDDEEEDDDDEEGSLTEGRPSDDDFISVGDSPDRGPEVEVYDMVKHQTAEGMEETQRASSTLDDVLQGMLEPSSNRRARSPERSANHRARSPERSANHRARSPGTRLHSRHVMIMEAEMDVEGASSRPGGDTAERQLQEVASDPPGLVMSAKPDDRAEYQGIWSHPHRVIVLEHTPGKEPYRRTREPQD